MNRLHIAASATDLARAACIALALSVSAAPEAGAQWVTTHEQFYLQAKHNWEFRDRYQAADRLFNAFDYGHAILYETLWRRPDAPASLLEEKEYDRLTKKILVQPPRVPLEEGAIEIAYARLAPEAKVMFEWAHILHRQIYDIWADESTSAEEKDRHVAHLLDYYRSRPDIAFSSRPKSMELMQEQPYSLAFRQRYPKFNGLIWAYHWLQVGLYEPLIVGRTVEERQALVRGTVARFWQMLEEPPETMPYQMPMTAVVAPAFAARYPEAAIIFDNLHSMHDVISDILANAAVPRSRKRAEILRAARLFRDDTSYVMPVDAWLTMSREMGVENMGGPAVGFTPALPAKTVTYGAVMQHDEQTGRMTGMKVGEMTGAHGAMQHGGGQREGMAHGAMQHDSTARGAMAHGAMQHDTAADAGTAHGRGGMPAMDAATAAGMMTMHMRMMADPIIRQRMLADTTMRRLMMEMMRHMPDEHRADMERMMRETPAARARPERGTTQSGKGAAGQPKRKAARPASKAAPKPAPKRDPHAGHRPPE